MSEFGPIELTQGDQDALNLVANYEPKAATWLVMHELEPLSKDGLNTSLSPALVKR